MYYNSETTNCPLLYLAAADYAAAYRTEHLSAHDAQRAQQKPQLHRRPDWQTSRALLQLCHTVPHRSISHSQGCAAVLAAETPHIGTDIEHIRPRDFSVWQQHVFQADELIWLHRQTDYATACYALWTLKESLLKACGKELADIRNVGLMRQGNAWLPHHHGHTAFQGGVWLLNSRIIFAAAWPQHTAAPHIIRLGQAARMSLRPLYLFQAA